MYAALAEQGMRYDASEPGGRGWPQRHPSGIYQFYIPSVTVPGGGRALYFDDNMRTVLQGVASARGLRGNAAAAFMEDAYYRAGLSEFMSRYRGARAPFLVSGHGGFRRGTIRLMRRVCRLPDVRCSGFSEAVAYLDAHPELVGRSE